MSSTTTTTRPRQYPLPPPSSPSQRKSTYAPPATAASPPAATSPATFASTLASETTGAPFQVAKLDAPGKITSSSSQSRLLVIADPELTPSFSYRIHLSPGSRRSSSSATRAAIARAVGANGSTSKSSRSSAVVTPERLSSSSSSPPPPLEHATLPPPPDSPPALVQAYPVSVYNDALHSGSNSSRSSTPLENGYPMISAHSQALSNGHMSSQPSPLPSHYSDSPPTYTESSHHSYGYVSPSSHAPPTSAVDHSYDYSYNEKSPLPRLQSSALHHASMDSIHDHSPPTSAQLSSVSSRLSISHISHPQSYPNHYHAVSSPSPDSVHSVSPHSQASGPPTPNYSAYHDDRHDGSAYHTIESVPDHSGMTNGYVSPQSHILHGSYSHSIIQQGLPRYESPPPILAPIQDERVIRGDVRISHVQPSPVSSIPPTPLSSSYLHYPYHAPHMSLNQTWKHDVLLRGRS